VKELTLDPDEHMRWIYDYRHPDYNSSQAIHLRAARAAAIASAPDWMVQLAASQTMANLEGGVK
jgi:hypothetical protein